MQYGELRSYCGSRLVKFILWIFIDFKDTCETGESFLVIFSSSSSSLAVREIQIREREDGDNSDISPVPVSNMVDARSGQPDETQANKIQKPNKKKTTIERGNPLDSEIPERLQEFSENLVDDEIPLQGGSHASSSHEDSFELTTKRREDLGKHSVQTHFPKDRNCEICKRTKITRAPCRRRSGGAVLRAENFGDLITSDHKVLSESCESRNNHRYAVVLQDLATQWIQAFPCKRKLHNKPRESKSSWNPRGNQKSFTITWKTFWATIYRTFYSICIIGWVLPYNCIGSVPNPWNWKEYALYAGRIWKGDVLNADLEELETMDASEIYSKRLNAKEVIFLKQGEFIFQSQMDESKHPEEIRNWQHPLWDGNVQFEGKVTLIFLENQKSLIHHFMTRFRMSMKQLKILGPRQEAYSSSSRWT